MRRAFFVFSLAFWTICILNCFTTIAYGRDKDQPENHPNGIVQDWSRRHLLYPRLGPLHSMISLQNDPRAVLAWQDSARKDWLRWRYPHPVRAPQSGFHTDWSIPLGTGSVAPAMYPAKYTFNPNAIPSCANDFVVFPINVNASTTQPNVVAFNNLYSGTTPTTGICSTRTVQGGITDDVDSATVLWSYYINADNEAPPPDVQNYAATSPALSLDGTKVAVAIIDTTESQYGHFIVLAPKAGDGVTTNLQTVTSPVVISSFSTTAVTANSGTATSLEIDWDGTISSPFVDYQTDSAYLGDFMGNLYHILDVFCTTSTCQTGGTPAPSLDTTGLWNGYFGLATGCPGELTSPVVDGFGNVFVGCSDGTVYGFNSAAAALMGSPITVGSGGATGGIVDAPLVDVVNGYLYVASGNSSGTTSVVAQIQDTGTSMSLIGTAALDPGGAFNLHAPGFNEDYFSSGTASDWLLYEYSANTGGSSSSIWGIGFGANHVMNTSTPTNVLVGTSGAFERSPITTFFNGTTDFLFSSDLGASAGDSGVANYDISGSTFPTTNLAFTAEGEGTGGIIVDNDSSEGQASSIYFGVLGTGTSANSAVKLTQSGLE